MRLLSTAAFSMVLLFHSLLIVLAQAPPSAEEVFAAAQKKYADGSSMRIKFVMKNEDIRGSLALKRGNKYILETGGHTIICNGKTVCPPVSRIKLSFRISATNPIISRRSGFL